MNINIKLNIDVITADPGGRWQQGGSGPRAAAEPRGGPAAQIGIGIATRYG